MNSDATFAAVKVRLRKKRIGSIGASARSSHSTNRTSASRPPDIVATTSVDAQPASLPRTRAHTIPSRAAGEKPQAARVESRVAAVRFLQPRQRERDQDEAERHVEP